MWGEPSVAALNETAFDAVFRKNKLHNTSYEFKVRGRDDVLGKMQ
jgi:hypothetical protein